MILRVTSDLGTELGGVAPFRYKSDVRLLVSSSLFKQQYVYINAGRNDIIIRLNGSNFFDCHATLSCLRICG